LRSAAWIGPPSAEIAVCVTHFLQPANYNQAAGFRPAGSAAHGGGAWLFSPVSAVRSGDAPFQQVAE
jgi:hypothetical protein